MIKVERETINKLDYDLDVAVADFTAEKEAHKLTENVPAPTATPLVEAVYNAGGYEIIEGETGLPENSVISLTSRIAILEVNYNDIVARVEKLESR
jgi:hypothetical protein